MAREIFNALTFAPLCEIFQNSRAMKSMIIFLLILPSLLKAQEVNNDVVNAASFGMVAGMKGAEVPLQKAIDWMLKSKKAGTLLIPPGVFYFGKGVLIAKDEDNNKSYEFVSIKIKGSGRAFGGMGGNGEETTLVFSNPNDFGIGIQMAKGVTIENLVLYGANDGKKPEGKNIASATFKDYVKLGVRDNRFSPHAGIAIDPFGGKGGPDQSPGWAGSYPQRGSSGSTRDALMAALSWIANSLNGTKSNAECILVENIWMEALAVAISSGQAQAKTVMCRNFKVWGGCWRVFDTQKFGAGSGNGYDVNGANLAGGIKWICDAPAFGTAQNNLSNVFAEMLYGIGGPEESENVVAQGRINISNSQLDLIGQNGAAWTRVKAAAKCGTLAIRDSYVGYYSGSDPCPVMVITNHLILDNVSGNPILNYDFLYAPKEAHVFSMDNWFSGNEQARSRHIKLSFGDVFYFKDKEYTIRKQYVGDTYYTFEVKGEVVKADDHSAVLLGAKNLLKDDILYDRGDVDFKPLIPAPYPVGVVDRVNKDSTFITFSSLKKGPVSLFTVDQPELLDLSEWWGDIESGNKKVKTRTIFGNRNRPFNEYKGRRIYNRNFPTGTYIVDWDDSGMLLSQPPSKSSKNYSFTVSDYFVTDTLGRQH